MVGRGKEEIAFEMVRSGGGGAEEEEEEGSTRVTNFDDLGTE
jgi:hypothetical protein